MARGLLCACGAGDGAPGSRAPAPDEIVSQSPGAVITRPRPCVMCLEELSKISEGVINSRHGESQGRAAGHSSPQGQLVRSPGFPVLCTFPRTRRMGYRVGVGCGDGQPGGSSQGAERMGYRTWGREQPGGSSPGAMSHLQAPEQRRASRVPHPPTALSARGQPVVPECGEPALCPPLF